ncbi:SH3 domain-containing protein [Vallitalea pronyensis]|uniref:SH3 domain-containing protein n=1 Tax=Vallitalea pronyensis TaxID=1348613 RepID=A0A8J8MNZ4_9FIRM|nr:C40 family peptidase [Vallitalea pronyensis]QUI25066.1 SH3 domain-containing protein [Vallitalea pronyensis]
MKKRGIGKFTFGLLGSLLLTTNIYASSVGVVNVENLNVRSGPSTSSSIIDYVHLGDVIEILSTKDEWHKIHMDNKSDAYVHSQYVEVKDTQSSLVSSEEANLFDGPNVMAGIIGTLKNGQSVKVLYAVDDWYYVETEQGKGYIHYKTLSATKSPETVTLTQASNPQEIKKRYAVVTTSILNVRHEPSTSSKKIDKVYQNNAFEIISELEDWVSIKTANGSTGYLHKDYVSISDEVPTITETSDLRQQVVNYALQFKGNRYVYGGNSLTKGVDCSGFAQQVMKKFGISISRTSRSQINDGQRISKSDLLPGDLVFFGYNGRINHVAIYMGNNMIIHANNPESGIIVNALNDRRMATYIGATRVIK